MYLYHYVIHSLCYDYAHSPLLVKANNGGQWLKYSPRENSRQAWPSNMTAEVQRLSPEDTVAEAVAEARRAQLIAEGQMLLPSAAFGSLCLRSTAAKIAKDYATAISKSWKDFEEL